ncbi:fungal specific transcription factor [Colletotrichum salicis]|uniref:Fungal specific transcription factor n=1 Tax=Colletotrichum salicis TaxID=1209931 RepID=A0A135RVK0_9PEZI|nr:fungal specific transcription factor [Colletotrichum salicis]
MQPIYTRPENLQYAYSDAFAAAVPAYPRSGAGAGRIAPHPLLVQVWTTDGDGHLWTHPCSASEEADTKLPPAVCHSAQAVVTEEPETRFLGARSDNLTEVGCIRARIADMDSRATASTASTQCSCSGLTPEKALSEVPTSVKDPSSHVATGFNATDEAPPVEGRSSLRFQMAATRKLTENAAIELGASCYVNAVAGTHRVVGSQSPEGASEQQLAQRPVTYRNMPLPPTPAVINVLRQLKDNPPSSFFVLRCFLPCAEFIDLRRNVYFSVDDDTAIEFIIVNSALHYLFTEYFCPPGLGNSELWKQSLTWGAMYRNALTAAVTSIDAGLSAKRKTRSAQLISQEDLSGRANGLLADLKLIEPIRMVNPTITSASNNTEPMTKLEDVLAISAGDICHTTATLICREKTSRASVPSFSPDCLSYARATIDAHLECVPLMSGDLHIMNLYLHWRILQTPFIPLLVVFCHIVETQDTGDAQRLKSFADSLMQGADLSPSAKEFYDITRELCMIAEKHIETSSQQDWASVPSLSTFGLSQFYPAGALAENYHLTSKNVQSDQDMEVMFEGEQVLGFF